MIGPWYVALARRVVPAHWRDDVTDDLTDEARLHGRSPQWLVRQLLRVGVTMRWSLATDSVSADVRYAVRSLVAARWFTVGTILTFMLGVGVNIAVFCAVDRLVFRPLPYSDPDSLVLLRSCDRTTGGCTMGSFRAAVSFQLVRHSTTIGDVAVAGFSLTVTQTRNGATLVYLIRATGGARADVDMLITPADSTRTRMYGPLGSFTKAK